MIILRPGNDTRAFLVGRQMGMRQLMDELAEARAETARIAAELERERRRYGLARKLLERALKIERFAPAVTLH